ncbi:MAG: AAA family ATPase [Candidatus Cloacimonetes bacterium]|nr:AAA family ATPase [Candidatus Cloacimonadota bacterium]
MFTKVAIKNFTAFDCLEMSFSPGINVLIGENGTGKTHILKALYSSADITSGRISNWAQKIMRVYLPSEENIGRLIKRGTGVKTGSIEVFRMVDGKELSLKLSFDSTIVSADDVEKPKSLQKWLDSRLASVFIPVKEMLANAPGFKSLYESRLIHFEEVYADIISKALIPPLIGSVDEFGEKIGTILRKAIDGETTVKNEQFFLKNRDGNLEFTLLAEGFRKLGLLWILIQNGVLANGTVLFWDEPEANLNPKLTATLIEVILQLQRSGVQVFLSTHNDLVAKWIDLLSEKEDKELIKYHVLYRDEESREIKTNSFDNYDDVSPNPLEEAYVSILHEEIESKTKGLGK